MFHNRGATTEKALSPAHFLETGTTKLVLPEKRSYHSILHTSFKTSFTYSIILYTIISRTGNQSSWLSKGETCSNLGFRHTNWAHLFCSLYRRFRSFFEIPQFYRPVFPFFGLRHQRPAKEGGCMCALAVYGKMSTTKNAAQYKVPCHADK